MSAARVCRWIPAFVGLALGGLLACSRSEPDATSVSPPPTLEASARGPGLPGPMPTATQLGAVALPDSKACVKQCSERREGDALSADAVESACRAECTKECLEHCKQKRSGTVDFETICARDCGSQEMLLR